jgi:hypothetical protein
VQQARQCELTMIWLRGNNGPNISIDRTQKLKDARSEAAKELDQYRAEKDTELKAYEAKVSLYLL